MRPLAAVIRIQQELQDKEFGNVNLRDIERVRQLYNWLKANLPDESKISVPPKIHARYQNKHLRSFVSAMILTFIVRKNSK